MNLIRSDNWRVFLANKIVFNTEAKDYIHKNPRQTLDRYKFITRPVLELMLFMQGKIAREVEKKTKAEM